MTATESDSFEAAAAVETAAGAKAGKRARSAKSKLDAVCASAVDVAATALRASVTGDHPGDVDAVGDHLGATAVGDRLVTHTFACLLPGYRGWVWVVTVARAPRAKFATMCESALLPGDGALTSPAWEPFADRLQPGDVGAQDVLPFIDDDPRLEYGFEHTSATDVDAQSIEEFGLGRVRVLSREGRDEAAERWEAGSFGPGSAPAQAASATCASCGFMTPLAGSLRQAFAVCANEWSPADGRVVTLDFGCGSHSETFEKRHRRETPEHVVDEIAIDLDLTPSRGYASSGPVPEVASTERTVTVDPATGSSEKSEPTD